MTEEYTQDCTNLDEGQFHEDNGVSQVSEMAASETQQSGTDHINASKHENDDRKIFVGGLSWETTVKDLKEYFEKFGTVLDVNLKTDPTTNRSRGFGFVMFEDAAAVDLVLAEQSHTLHGKNIDPKRAKARGAKEPVLKIFVGGLDPNTPEEEVRSHFEQYGTITEIELPFDKVKNQRRGFCFITYETEAAAESACAEAKQDIAEGKTVDVKKATAKNDKFGGAGNYGGGGGRGRGGYGRGRGRGGGGGNYNQGNNGWGGYDYSDYNNYYGNNQGYDYSNYYNQGWGNYDYSGYYNQGWGNYNYQGYGNGSQNGGSGGGGKVAKSNGGNNKYQPY